MFAGFLAVTQMALRTFFRDRGALFWGIAFPIMLMGLIGTVFGSSEDLHLTASLVVPDDNPLNEGLRDGFNSLQMLTLVEEDEASALEALQRGDRSFVVILPDAADFASAQSVLTGRAPAPDGGPVSVQVYYDESQPQVAQAVVALVREVIGAANQQILDIQPLLTVDASARSTANLNMFDFLVPGILAMVIGQTGLMNVTWVVSNYREQKVLKRVLATPFSPFVFLAGLIARFTITNLVQSAIIVFIGVVVFGATIVGSFWNLFILAVFGSVTFLAIGFAVSTVSKTAESANNLGSAVFFPMLFLSGTFWPREMIPEGLHGLINLLPLTPLVDAMRGVATQGDMLSSYSGGLLYMGAWTLAAGFIASWRFRWE